MKHKLESRLPGEMSIISEINIRPHLWQKEKEELRCHLMKVKEKSRKAGLKLNIQKIRIMAFNPITSRQADEEKMETVTNFIFLGSKITADGDCSHQIIR